ncbi:MAG: hypothetical protein LBI69_01280 [Puniceicoccales bacterium]|nr:hypothetical protein [Puniceicoccales bacterium]
MDSSTIVKQTASPDSGANEHNTADTSCGSIHLILVCVGVAAAIGGIILTAIGAFHLSISLPAISMGIVVLAVGVILVMLAYNLWPMPLGENAIREKISNQATLPQPSGNNKSGESAILMSPAGQNKPTANPCNFVFENKTITPPCDASGGDLLSNEFKDYMDFEKNDPEGIAKYWSFYSKNQHEEEIKLVELINQYQSGCEELLRFKGQKIRFDAVLMDGDPPPVLLAIKKVNDAFFEIVDCCPWMRVNDLTKNYAQGEPSTTQSDVPNSFIYGPQIPHGHPLAHFYKGTLDQYEGAMNATLPSKRMGKLQMLAFWSAEANNKALAQRHVIYNFLEAVMEKFAANNPDFLQAVTVAELEKVNRSVVGEVSSARAKVKILKGLPGGRIEEYLQKNFQKTAVTITQGCNEGGFGDNGLRGQQGFSAHIHDYSQGPTSSSQNFVLAGIRWHLCHHKDKDSGASGDSKYNFDPSHLGTAVDAFNAGATTNRDDMPLYKGVSFELRATQGKKGETSNNKANNVSKRMSAINKRFETQKNQLKVLPNPYVNRDGVSCLYMCTSSIHAGDYKGSNVFKRMGGQDQFTDLCRNYAREQYMGIAHAAKILWKNEQAKPQEQRKRVVVVLSLLGGGVYCNPKRMYPDIFKEFFEELKGIDITVLCSAFDANAVTTWKNSLTSAGYDNNIECEEIRLSQFDNS